jgi:hypothetical protein
MNQSCLNVYYQEDAYTRSVASSYGVEVSDEMEIVSSVQSPTYRGLFLTALNRSNASMIGYANIDILFDSDLEETLHAVCK